MVEVVDLVRNYAHGFMLDRSSYSSKVPKNLPPLNDLDIVLQALFTIAWEWAMFQRSA